MEKLNVKNEIIAIFKEYPYLINADNPNTKILSKIIEKHNIPPAEISEYINIASLCRERAKIQTDMEEFKPSAETLNKRHKMNIENIKRYSRKN